MAAAGNDGAGKPEASGFAPYSYPAAFPGVVSVGATDRGLRRASFSNWNPSVMVAAPGVDILGAGPGDEYWVGRGTSQATALVSGVAALIKAKYPEMSPALVAQALTAGATRKPKAGYSTGTGFGVVSAAGSLAEAARLAGHTQTAKGAQAFDPTKRMAAGSTGPIQVVHRDHSRVTVYGAIAAAAAIASLTALAIMVALVRRARRSAPSAEA